LREAARLGGGAASPPEGSGRPRVRCAPTTRVSSRGRGWGLPLPGASPNVTQAAPQASRTPAFPPPIGPTSGRGSIGAGVAHRRACARSHVDGVSDLRRHGSIAMTLSRPAPLSPRVKPAAQWPAGLRGGSTPRGLRECAERLSRRLLPGRSGASPRGRRGRRRGRGTVFHPWFVFGVSCTLPGL